MDAETASLLDSIQVPEDFWFRATTLGNAEQEYTAGFLIAAAKEINALGPISWDMLFKLSLRNLTPMGLVKTGIVELIQKGLVEATDGIKGPYTINPELLRILTR